MARRGSQSEERRLAANVLFESRYRWDAVATSLMMRLQAGGRLLDRWPIWRRGALVAVGFESCHEFGSAVDLDRLDCDRHRSGCQFGVSEFRPLAASLASSYLNGPS